MTRQVIFWIALLCAHAGLVSSARGGPLEDSEDVRLGPLDAVVLRGDPSAPTVVYLHGFGGSSDLAFESLREQIESNAQLGGMNWIFPDAPRGGWFRIEAIDPITTEPLFDVWQETLKPTRVALKRMLRAARVEPEKVIWAGFSQGAITAIDYVLHDDVAPDGLIVDSGIYFDSSDWNRRSRHLRDVPFFMTHDRRDSTLPFTLAKFAESLLQSRGMKGRLTTNTLGHQMSPAFVARSALSILSRECSRALRRKSGR